MRFSGQPFDSASSINGSSFAWSRTTPDTTSRKNAASAGRYLSPSTSPPSQWLSNSAKMSLMPAPPMSIWYSACTAASRAAPRRLAFLSGVFFWESLVIFEAPHKSVRIATLDPQHRERRARGVAAFVELAFARASPRLLFGIDGDDAIAQGNGAIDGNLHQRAGGFHRHDLEMNGVAANHATQRNDRIEVLAAILGGIQRHRDRRWNLQRAGHRDDFMGSLGFPDLGQCALQQRVLDIVIKPRLDDQNPRAGDIGLVFQRCAAGVCHFDLVIAGLDPAIHLIREALLLRGWIPGSSPRMTHLWLAPTSSRSAARRSAPSGRLRD